MPADSLEYARIRAQLLADKSGFVDPVTGGAGANFSTLTGDVASLQQAINALPAISGDEAALLARLYTATQAQPVPSPRNFVVTVLSGTYETDVPVAPHVTSASLNVTYYTAEEMLASFSVGTLEMTYNGETETVTMTPGATTITPSWSGTDAFGETGWTLTFSNPVFAGDGTYSFDYSIRDSSDAVQDSGTVTTTYYVMQNPGADTFVVGSGSATIATAASAAVPTSYTMFTSDGYYVSVLPLAFVGGDYHVDDIGGQGVTAFAALPTAGWIASISVSYEANCAVLVADETEYGSTSVTGDPVSYPFGSDSYDRLNSIYYYSYYEANNPCVFRIWNRDGTTYSAGVDAQSDVYLGYTAFDDAELGFELTWESDFVPDYPARDTVILFEGAFGELMLAAINVSSGATWYPYRNPSSPPSYFDTDTNTFPGEGAILPTETFPPIHAAAFSLAGPALSLNVLGSPLTNIVANPPSEYSYGALLIGDDNLVDYGYSDGAAAALAVGRDNHLFEALAFALGRSNRVFASRSLAVGYGHTVYSAANDSLVWGLHSQTAAPCTVVGGAGAKARVPYSMTLGSGAPTQHWHAVNFGATANATPFPIPWGTVTGSSTYALQPGIPIPNGRVIFFVLRVVARGTSGSAAGYAAAYLLRGAARNKDGTSALIGSVTKEVWEDSAMSGCDVAVTADDTNDRLVVTVTGLAQTVQWGLEIEVTELGG